MNLPKSANADQSWICCQIGAREHYAVPRALLASGCDVRLITDVWATKTPSWWMPKRWRQRHHQDIADQRVTAWNYSALKAQLLQSGRRRSLWQRIQAIDLWFQQKCAEALPQIVSECAQPPTVFAYSYGAKAIFQKARQLGCQTVLGQIDPGPVEMRLVQGLEQKYGFADMEWPQRRYWDNWQNECALADHIVVNSEWSRQALQQEGVDTNKIATIPLAYQRAADVEMNSNPMPAEFSANRRLRVLFLGQVNLRKGVKELAQAIRLLQNDPVEWTVVGGGDERLMSELRELPLTTVTGPVSRAEARRHYQQADVFILPTHSDGFALTQLEAAAYGLPIVASLFCGDVIRHHQNGLRLGEVSPSAIVDAIRELTQNPHLVDAMHQRQQEMNLLSLSDLGSQFLSLHHRCVQNAA